MKKTYLKPRMKTLDVMTENILNMTSVNDEIGDGNQLGRETDFDETPSEFGIRQTNVWE